DWRRHLVVVTPDTVIRWHRAGWRLYWRWRSRAGGGRPRPSPGGPGLGARVAPGKPLWGGERVPRGPLQHPVAPSKPPLPPSPGPTAEPDVAHLPGQPRARDLGR